MRKQGKKKTNYKIFGSLTVISVSVMAVLLVFGGNLAAQNPENTEAPGEPESQSSDVGVYVGKLIEGQSYLIFGGEPTVELIFEDNRKFTAPEQLAAEANMQINGTYRIIFDSSAPGVALEIMELIG